jgi:hypothetical protein
MNKDMYIHLDGLNWVNWVYQTYLRIKKTNFKFTKLNFLKPFLVKEYLRVLFFRWHLQSRKEEYMHGEVAKMDN